MKTTKSEGGKIVPDTIEFWEAEYKKFRDVPRNERIEKIGETLFGKLTKQNEGLCEAAYMEIVIRYERHIEYLKS